MKKFLRVFALLAILTGFFGTAASADPGGSIQPKIYSIELEEKDEPVTIQGDPGGGVQPCSNC